jgi:hypothetical protein
MSRIYSFNDWSEKLHEAELEGGTDSKSDKDKDVNSSNTSSQHPDVTSGAAKLSQECISKLVSDKPATLSEINSTDSKLVSNSDISKDIKDLLSKTRIASSKPGATAELWNKLTSGDSNLLPKSETGGSAGFFKWMPTDRSCSLWKLEPISVKSFGGPISWVFEDNFFAPVEATASDREKSAQSSGGASLGFINLNSSKKNNPFKPGDVVYVGHLNQSGLSSEAKSAISKYSGIHVVTNKKPRMDETGKGIYTKHKDYVITDSPRVGNTPAVPGYMVLLSRAGKKVSGIGRSAQKYTAQTF